MNFKNIIIYIPILGNVIEIIALLIPILMSVAFVTIAERKVMASCQRRVGPNAVGVWGILQPFADALKLLFKELIIPRHSNIILFVLGPTISLFFAVLGWAVIPITMGVTLFDFNIGIFFALAVSSLGIYGILIAGWAANSKYAFIGSIRSTAQLLSYELVLSSIILLLIFFSSTFNFSSIIENQFGIWNVIPFFPIFLIFLIGANAELNRPPFDLPEAESELVAGFMTEHSASIFVFFFLAEYCSLIFMSALTVIFFLGGSLLPEININFNILFDFIFNSDYVSSILPSTFSNYDFSFSSKYIYDNGYGSLVLALKVILVIFLFIWIRASFPRFRYDQLMSLCWTVLLPLLFGWILLIACIIFSFDILPL
jgi:NADH-ubiquinone oxidoreductase chain 1